MTRNKLLISTVTLAVAGLTGGTAVYAQGNYGSRTTNTVPDSTVGKTADTTFMNKAASGGMAEVKFAQLAQQKASSPSVKDFAIRMSADHSRANMELKGVAAKDNVTLPTILDAQDQATNDRLSKLSGKQFDREYMRVMVQDHEKDVSEFKRESTSGKDPSIKNFASETLPTLEEHLKMARQTDKEIGGSAAHNADTGAKPAQ